MKLVFLIILLCGINSSAVHTVNCAKAKKGCVCSQKATTPKATTSNLDIIPAGLLFQF